MSTKFSQFPNGGNPRVTDIPVGLRGLVNTKFTFTGINDTNGNPILVWSAGNFTVVGPGVLGLPVNTTAELPAVGEEGQAAYDSTLDSIVYWSANAAAWVPIGSGSGTITAVNGTANQISSVLAGSIVTLSLPSSLILPGTLALGNLSFSGNTISSTNANGNINFVPNGTGINILANAQVSNLTPNRAVVSDASDNLISSVTSLTELSYLQGATSNIQTQINSIVSGNLTAVNGTANQINASTLSGVVTLTLPSTMIVPGTLTLNANPTTALEAATKQYVDAIAAGLSFQPACYAGTTANLTSTYNNGAAGVGATLTNTGVQAAFATDGVSVAVNARVLVKDQTNAYENGIYTLTTVGSGATDWVLTRATDYDTNVEIQPGDFILITAGSTLVNTAWIQTDTVTTMGTSPITFNQFNPGAGAVMNVTASAPLASSGGQNPNISLSAPVPLTLGGSNASLVASNGGLIYSTATAMAVLAGTATAGQIPLSGSSAAPSWSTATYLATLTANGLLYASSTNTLGQITTANNSILATSAGGVPSLTTTMPTAVQLSVSNYNSGTAASSSTFLRGDGTWAATGGSGGLGSVQVYTSGNTWNKPVGLVRARVTVTAGGGSGGGASATVANFGGASGGGAGGTSIKLIAAGSLGASESVTVGAGGAAVSGNNGNAGASSSFGSHCSATGGGPGLADGNSAVGAAAGGVGGVGSSGDINLGGGGGGSCMHSSSATVQVTGMGGTSYWGGGGAAVSFSSNGVAGGNYGAGGSGANNNAGEGARPGGAGAGGIVIVEEYF